VRLRASYSRSRISREENVLFMGQEYYASEGPELNLDTSIQQQPVAPEHV